MQVKRLLPLLAVLALAAAACGAAADGPPHIEVDRSACAHCGMLISEPLYAAAYQAPGAEPRLFDDIACLLRAVEGEPRAEGLTYWFHDVATGQWIAGQEAVFVRSSVLPTPMGGGFLAYRDPAAVATAAERHQGQVIGSLGELLAGAGTPGKEGEQ
jgi:copper chaperone NosL